MRYQKFAFLSATFVNLNREDLLSLFFLSLFTGFYTLFGLICIFLHGGILEAEETKIFILGWITAPASAILAVPFFIRLRRKYIPDTPQVFLHLAFVNTMLFVSVSTVLSISHHFFRTPLLWTSLSYLALIMVPFINMAACFRLKYYSHPRETIILWGFPLVGCLGLINFIGLYPFFSGQYSTSAAIIHLSLLVAMLILFIKEPLRNRCKSPLIIYGIDTLIIVLIILACLDASFSIHLHQQGFYMGPVNRVMNGGLLLVDTFCQYGVAVIYFLAFLFKGGWAPFSYQGFSFIISIISILHFCCVYLLLIKLIKNRLYALLMMIVALLLGVYGTMGVMQAAPSTGPLRFGLPYMVLVLILIRRGFQKPHRLTMIWEYFIVGIASLWSFETFIYTLFMYLGICLFESFEAVADDRPVLRALFYRLVFLLGTIVSCQLLFILFTYAGSQKFPDWSSYFDFIRIYSTGEFGTVLIEPWSPWIFPLAIYFTSLMVFLFRNVYLKNKGNDSTESLLIFGLTIFGIVQYTYFLGRSHPNNLYHISTPAVIIAGYWFIELIQKKHFPLLFRLAMKYVFFAACTLIVLSTMECFAFKYRHNQTGLRLAVDNMTAAFSGRSHDRFWDTLKVLIHKQEENPQVIEAAYFIHKYTQEPQDVVVLLQTENTTETLITAGRKQLFPLNDLEEDVILPSLRKKILTYQHDLKVGDMIFVLKNPSAYGDIKKSPLQIQLIDRLCHEFAFQVVEDGAGGVAVMKLKPCQAQGSEYCDGIRKMAVPLIPAGPAVLNKTNLNENPYLTPLSTAGK
jgi:hypothetical protein